MKWRSIFTSRTKTRARKRFRRPDTIASHGVLVAGTVPQEVAQVGAAPRQETADDMRAAIDWARKENARTGSPLNRKIASEDFSRSRSAPIPASKPSACLIPGWRHHPPGAVAHRRNRLRTHSRNGTGPLLLLNGDEPDFLMRASAATFEAINHVPEFCSVTTGSCGRSKATKKPVRCSSARTAVSAQTRTGM